MTLSFRASGSLSLHRSVIVCLLLLLGAAQYAQAAPIDGMVKDVKFDDGSAVTKLLDNGKGMDPNSVDQYGMPLLVIAAREKSDQAAEALMNDPRIDLNATDKAGENALMMAAISHDQPLVERLIAKGAAVNKTGWTPLHYAASAGDDGIVKVLLAHSANIDAGSPNGSTALMMAARGDHLTTVQLLIGAGADPAKKNQLNLNAADFAAHYDAPDVNKWFKQHPPAGTSPATVPADANAS